MKNIKKKTCLDCFFCKVSRKAVVKSGLCFCAKKQRQIERKEKYWRSKEVCRLFNDMSA